MESNSEVVQRVEQVTATGTSWIICRSKSHGGRIYYFNTMTGEATWNLSEAEMDKVRRRMKRIPNQEDLNIIGACPEPSEPPTHQKRESPTSNAHNNDSSTSHLHSPSTVYNEQIINNQFPKQQFPIAPIIVPSLNVVPSMIPNVIQNSGNHLCPIAMNSSNTRFNDNVWAVAPPPQHIQFNPNLSLVNQGQPSVNAHFDNQIQPLNVPFNSQVPPVHVQFTNQKQPTNVKFTNQGSFNTQEQLTSMPFINQGQHPYLPFNNQAQTTNVLVTNPGPPTYAPFNNQGQATNVPFTNQGQPTNVPFNNRGQPKNVPLNNQTIGPFNNQEQPTNMPFTNLRQPTNMSFNNHKQLMNMPFTNQSQPTNVPLNIRGQPTDVPFNNQEQLTNVPFNNQRQPTNVPFNNRGQTTNVPFTNERQPANLPFNDQDICISVQNTSTFLSSCFQKRINLNSPPQDYKKQRIFPWKKHNNNKFENFDLRTVLSAKKLRRQKYQADNIKEKEQNHNENSRALSQNEQVKDDSIVSVEESRKSETQTQKDETVDADEDWIEENFFVEDGKIKLNVTNLKELTKNNMDLKHLHWYIVADKDMLLNHLNFLNILRNSDDDCCLMVPQNVLRELQTAEEDSVCRIATRAKRAVLFLLQLIERENVIIGVVNCAETDTRCDYLLKCCANLLEQNHHVVLLTDDVGFKTFKGESQIPIFNMKELKEVLTKPEPVNVKKKDLRPPPCLHAKPVKSNLTSDLTGKPNTVRNNVTSDLTGKPNTGVLNQEKDSNKLNTEPLKESEIQVIKTDVLFLSQTSDSSAKHISETGVKSDVAVNNNVFNKANNEASQKESINSDEIISSENHKIASSTTTSENKLMKKEIRLNRGFPVTNSESAVTVPVTTQKRKQFRWRKKKLASGNYNDCKLISSISSNVDKNDKDIPHKKVDPTSTIKDPEKHENLVSDETLLNDVNRFKQNPNNEKVTIEKTSTFEIVSNTTNNVDSESEKHPIETFVFMVMFEVEDQKMEHSLRVMNDEWLSRFWQIMEEVLMQILRQDEQFLNNVVYKLQGGGPWSILEAADCIKIKFKDHSNVLDAAKTLSNLLAKITDSTGRIIVNLKPSEFMEMYSYGVHLVEVLVSVIGNCEDLCIASQSLLKLLNDIKDPNLDLSLNDTFGDHIPQDTSLSDTPHVPQSPLSKNESTASPSPKKTKSLKPAVLQSPPTIAADEKKAFCSHTFNSRSTMRTPEKALQQKDEQYTEQPVKFIRTANTQDSVLPLNLSKKMSNIQESSNTLYNSEAKTNTQDVIASIFDRNENGLEPRPGTDYMKVEFCPEYKNNLVEGNRKPEIQPLDMDNLDYSDYYTNDDYLSQDEFEGGNLRQYNNLNVDFYYEGALEITLPQTNDYSFLTNYDCHFENNSPLNVNYNLNCIFSLIIAEVKGAHKDIKSFCEKTSKELFSPVYSSKRKSELHEEAKTVKIMVDKLCEALYSLHCRETNDFKNNIQAILRKAGIYDFDFNDDLLHVYRDVIGNCFKQAKALQESVAAIVTVVNNKPTSL